MKEIEIGIISVNRAKNYAYGWTRMIKPFYSAGNIGFDLSWIEEIFGCTFIDGDLPHYVTIILYEERGDLMEFKYKSDIE